MLEVLHVRHALYNNSVPFSAKQFNVTLLYFWFDDNLSTQF